jgi:hypothetical protein
MFKAICIRANEFFDLHKGKIYTITDVKQCSCGDTYYSYGIKTDEKGFDCRCGKCLEKGSLPEYYALANRFAQIDESFAEETLEMIKEQIEEEYLVLK